VKSASPPNLSRILIIDDDAAVRRLVSNALAKHGFEASVAVDGAEGIALAARQLPDLILCDLAMPAMDGFEVLSALRQDPKLADIPIIFLTGQAEPDQVRQGMNLGADDYLPKPVEVADLIGAIKARLSRRGSERQRQEKQLQRAIQVFAEVVHDLRDPLFVVLGCTDLLKNGVPLNEPTDRSKQVLARMEQAITRMQAIVTETLFLAKYRMQHLSFDPKPMDLRGFCEHMVAHHEHRQRLRLECDAEPFPIVADGIRLQQALDNLLSNALKYSEGAVTIRLTKLKDRYRLEVTDCGIGIPAKEQCSIFEPFFRASNTSGKPGHGLGLCIVKSCVEQHCGRMSFRSEPQQGTSFSVELPLSPVINLAHPGKTPGSLAGQNRPATADASTAPSPSAQSSVPRKPVPWKPHGLATAASPPRQFTGILVDDDPLVRSLLKDMLEPAKDLVIVGEAGNLSQGRLLARHQNPDVVFLDVGLPDGSGFELLANLQPTAAVVFVTSAEEYAVHAFDCEATDFLLKPVNSARLHQALERVRLRLAAQIPVRPPQEDKVDGSVLIKTLTEKRLVPFRDIRSIVAYGEYSRVFWDKDKAALLRKPLKQWQSELPSAQFVRVHRQAIVNLAYMQRIEKLPNGKLQVHVRDTLKPFPVSLRLAPMLNRKLKTFCVHEPEHS
jgi:DNA-binding LytR/AlgR family response regulator